jgi:hypothetical protein
MLIITQDDLLQYLYKESSPEKTLIIKEALETDAAVKERMQVLRTGKERLDLLSKYSPDTRTLDNIFNYAAKGIEAFS